MSVPRRTTCARKLSGTNTTSLGFSATLCSAMIASGWLQPLPSMARDSSWPCALRRTTDTALRSPDLAKGPGVGDRRGRVLPLPQGHGARPAYLAHHEHHGLGGVLDHHRDLGV